MKSPLRLLAALVLLGLAWTAWPGQATGGRGLADTTPVKPKPPPPPTPGGDDGWQMPTEAAPTPTLPPATATFTRRPWPTRTFTPTPTPTYTPTRTPTFTPSATPTPSRTPRQDLLALPSPTPPPTTPGPTTFTPMPAATVLSPTAAGQSRAGAASPIITGIGQAGLALLVAVLITLGGGWLAGRWNSATLAQAGQAGRAASQPPSSATTPLCPTPLYPTLLTPFMSEGGRILITGPSRSGKSTALHHLCRRALADLSFDEIVLLDGKGPELTAWSQVASDLITYCGPEDIEAWLAPLERIVAGLPGRYAALVQAGLRKAAPGDWRKLIIIDEIQLATRSEYGKKITSLMLTLVEQSGALGDVVIMTTQRATHQTLDKSIAYNANFIIALKGPDHPGYFDLFTSIEQKRPVRRGRVAPASDADITAWIAAVARLRGRDPTEDLSGLQKT